MASYKSRHRCHLNPSTEYREKKADIVRSFTEILDEAREVEVLWGAEPVAEITISGRDVLAPESEQRWAQAVRQLAELRVFVVESRKLFTSEERDAFEDGSSAWR
jgi:hypothetical protein